VGVAVKHRQLGR
jgi:hypothetical protein